VRTLLRAFAALKQRRAIPHGLLLLGPNHLNVPLGPLCDELGISDSVVQTDGAFSDHTRLVPIYNAADLFVHPSSYEGWSMTTMEALACGTAVVAVDRGGLGEVARGHALMVEEPTVEALADAMERVLSNPTLRQELQLKARKRGSAFRWEDTTRQTLEVIRRVATARVGDGRRGAADGGPV
jgi:glycosyltransferase involved in cell wall biosynthesis